MVRDGPLISLRTGLDDGWYIEGGRLERQLHEEFKAAGPVRYYPCVGAVTGDQLREDMERYLALESDR